MTADHLDKFLLQQRGARVIATEIEQAWQSAQQQQPQHPAVRELLGELVAAATLLTANLKFDGSLLLQLQGNGTVKMIVVECRQDLSFRATIKLNSEPQPHELGLQALLNADGQGRFSVILNPPPDTPGRQPYQGIVPLTADSVAGVLQDYMQQSEQLDTRLWLHSNDTRLCGFLLQRMPDSGGHTDVSTQDLAASWHHALALCETLTVDELATTDLETLLKRLFWDTPIVSLESLPITWRCGCTWERVANMLRSLGEAEVKDIIQEQGEVEVVCDFCGTPYRFDPIDSTALFGTPRSSQPEQLH